MLQNKSRGIRYHSVSGGNGNSSLTLSWKPKTEQATVPVIMEHHLWYPSERSPKEKFFHLQQTKRTPQDKRLGNLEKRDLCMLTTEDVRVTF